LVAVLQFKVGDAVFALTYGYWNEDQEGELCCSSRQGVEEWWQELQLQSQL
jgi:hypothetical protein